MVRLAVFSAWAQLQVASQEQKYLEDVLRPYLKRLTPLWLTSLREYAQLKFEPDISSAAAAISNDPNNLYAALNRETLLQVSHTRCHLIKLLAKSCSVLSSFLAQLCRGNF